MSGYEGGRLAALIDAGPDLLAALEAVEWIDTKTMIKVAEDGGKYYCPWCGGWGWNHPKHRDDCQRQAAIAKARAKYQEVLA